MKRSARVLAPMVTTVLALGMNVPAVAQSDTKMVDVKSNGTTPAVGAGFTSISKDGNLVAFSTYAFDLVPGDTNSASDVFVRNMTTGKTKRVSVSSGEDQADANSFTPVISGDGRYVVFASDADNLVPRDGNGQTDVFRRDLQEGVTELVSTHWVNQNHPHRRSVAGASTVPAVSFDGQEVAFVSTARATVLVGDTYADRNGQPDVYLRKWNANLPLGKTNLVSHRDDDKFRSANGTSGAVYHGTQLGVSVSDDGKYVAYGSTATVIDTSKTDANAHGADIFWGTVLQQYLVTRSKTGVQGNGEGFTPSLTADGCEVAFWSTSSNLLFNDTNNGSDIFVKDVCSNGAVVRANLAADGTQDLGGAAPLQNASISDDGSRVTFASFGQLTEPKNCGGEQVYVRKFDTAQTVRMSDTTDGQCGERFSNYAWVSGDGKYVTWMSASDHLVTGDANGDVDVFRRPVP